MKRADEIKAYKDAIRRLKVRRKNLYLSVRPHDMRYADYGDGLTDAIATLEKYLAKIERTK